jgi:hypothetical protein
MNGNDAKLNLIGTWTRETAAADRWQSFQALISKQAEPVYGWARRSSVPSRWRAVPASVSAQLSIGTA